MMHGDTGSTFVPGRNSGDDLAFDRRGFDPGKGLEKLEDRVLLAATPVTLDPNGEAVVAGSIDFGEVVFFEFTTPSFANGEDFVRILADANTAGDDLDTALGIFTSDDLQSARAVDAYGRTIMQATGNGTLEGGTPTDAWIGAVLEANTTYFVAVSSNSLLATTGAGDFNLRISTTSTEVDITAGVRTEVTSGPGDLTDINVRGTDLVFRIESGAADVFDSLITANAVADPTALDTRLDIYDSEGRFIIGDSNGGRIGNAFTAWRGGQSESYYIRVRSDQFLVLPEAEGEFTLVIEAQSTDLGVDPVTRLGVLDDTLAGVIEVTGEGATGDPALRQRSDSRLFTFTAQSTGSAVVSARVLGTAGIAGGLASDNDPGYLNADIKLRIYDPNGNLVLVVDDNPATLSTSPNAEFEVIGGQDYFIVVDNFEFAAPAGNLSIRVAVDASTNLERTPGTQELLVDDHPSLPDESLTDEERRRLADLATPIPWGPPEDIFIDRGFVQRGYVDGIIHGFNDKDSDLFQFTPPVDMLGGDGGDDGDSIELLAGGSFSSATGVSGAAVIDFLASNIASYDYGTFQPLTGSSVGTDELLFVDGSFIDGTVYTMLEWDRPNIVDGNVITETVLVIGGDFVLRDRTDLDPDLDPTVDSLISGMENLVVWDGVQFSALLPAAAKNDDVVTRYGLTFDERRAWSPDGEVRALELYDLDGDGVQELIIGGAFTTVVGDIEGDPLSNNLTGFTVEVVDGEISGGWLPINVPATARVNALTTYDPTVVGDEPDGFEDPELSLIVGQDDGIVRVLTLEGTEVSQTAQATARGGAATIWSFTTHTPSDVLVPDPDNIGQLIVAELPQMLVIGGEFTSFLSPGIAAPSVVMWNGILGQGGSTIGLNAAGGAASDLMPTAGNAQPIVYSVASWNPSDATSLGTNLPDDQSFIVIGGDFQVQSTRFSQTFENLALWTRSIQGIPGDPQSLVDYFGWESIGGFAEFKSGVDGIVRTLTIYEDNEEAGGESFTDEALVIGGDFRLYDFNGDGVVNATDETDLLASGRLPSNLLYYDADNNLDFRAALGGTDGSIYATTTFDPSRGTFRPNGRPLSSLQIRVTGTFDTQIGDLDVAVNLYDSNLELVGEGTITDQFFERFTTGGNPRVPNDAAGTNDVSLYVEFEDVSGVTLWGGEVYYLEVSAQGVDDTTNGAFPIGRYNVELLVDGFVDDNNVGTLDNLGSTFIEAPDNSNLDGRPLEDDVAGALPISIDPAAGRGFFNDGNRTESRNYANRPDNSELTTRSRLSAINSYDDTDLFTFTALRDGFVEVFISTVDLRNFYEVVGQGTENKIIQSALDPAVRIFNNNLTQIAYNDNIDGASSERQTQFNIDRDGDGVLDQGEVIQTKWTDSRVVFEVEAGQQYFVQVESAFLRQYLDYVAGTTDQMDWRHAIGAYDIFINTGASPSGTIISNGDDVVDAQSETNGFTGRAPLGFDAAGVSTFDGVIEDRSLTPARPADTDAFVFQAAGTGTATVSLARRDGSFTGSVQVFLADTGTQIATVTANIATGDASVDVLVTGGQRYVVIVSGATDGDTGLYTLRVESPIIVGDEADFGDWNNALDIPVSVSTNSGSIDGRLDHGADVDVFRFTAPQFAEYRVTVTSPSGLDLRLDIYEQQVAPLEASRSPYELPVFTLVRAIDDGVAGAPVATFGATPSRLTTGVSDRAGVGVVDLSAYYIVISQDIFGPASGSYTVTIELVAPDDHPNAGQASEFTDIVLDDTTGDGSQTGTFEIAGDTDQFRFTAPASGRVFATGSVTDGSNLRLTVEIFNASGTVLLASGSSVSNGGDALTTFVADRNESYLVVVRVVDGSPGPLTGDYSIFINATAADDHANTGEFEFATPIVLDPFSGDGMFPSTGATRPAINPANDTDLFTFTTLALGSVTVTVTPFVNSASDQFTPLITVFNAAQQPIASTIALTPQGVATITIPAGSNVGGDVYYILVADARSTADAIDVSPYEIMIDGPDIRTNPGDIDFDDSDPLPTPNPAGRTSVNGGINQPGERVLYEFTVPERMRDLRVFVQLVAVDPSGAASPLDGQIDILFDVDPTTAITGEGDPELVSILPGGVPTSENGPGSAARFDFVVAEGFQGGDAVTYYVIVSGVDNADGGDFRLDVVIEPEAFSYYMPEGWAGEGIREFVSLANPNDFNVTYTLTAYYEDTSFGPVTIVSNAVIPAGSRGGVTLSDALLYNSIGEQSATGIFSSAGIRVGEGYSLVLTANGALAANSSRYDFDSTTGATFTDQTSAQWSFARIERNPGVANDFVLIYNPNNFSVDVTFSTDAGDGTTVTITQTIEANRRGGWNIDAENVLPTGIFGAVVSATPTPTGNASQDAANQAAFMGIVASQTHFESTTEGGRGFAAIGDYNVGSLASAIPTITDSSSVESEIVIYNPAPFDATGATTATITFRGEYLADGLPSFTRTYTIEGGDVLRLSDASLGLIANQPVGIEILSDRGVTVIGVENRFGESNSVTSESFAAENWYFGDAFINAQLAGDFYLENLSFYNPNPDLGAAPLDITVTLLFFNADTGVTGESEDIVVSVDSRGFATLNLHDAQEILGRDDPLVYFSLAASADSPFIMNFYHYDLFLGGGWGVVGSPFGLLNPLGEILNG